MMKLISVCNCLLQVFYIKEHQLDICEQSLRSLLSPQVINVESALTKSNGEMISVSGIVQSVSIFPIVIKILTN